MKKFLFLSSALIMTVYSAFADDTATTDKKITGGAGTCTVDVLGVSADGATANTIATWTMNEYTLNPGEYLNVTETSVDKTTCPAGSYCVGGTGFTVDNAQTSIAQCPTGYPNSAEGAGTNTQCYTACTVDMVAKATAVTGNDYYGTGADTCGATACETGYHVDGGGLELVEKTPLAPISMTDAGDGYRYVNAGGTSNSEGTVDAIPADSVTAPNTWAVAYSEGVLYGKASCQPTEDPAYNYVMSGFLDIQRGDMTMEAFKSGLEPLAGSAKAEYAAGIITDVLSGAKGDAEMYKALYVVFASETDASYSTDNTGEYCYCQTDGFMPTNGTKQIVTSAPWVYHYGGRIDCAASCAYNCAKRLRDGGMADLAFRAAVVGALEAVETGGICAANTINIDWNPDNNGEHTINQCTYEGSITLPTPDPVKPGYTFTGWKLVEPTTTTE